MPIWVGKQIEDFFWLCRNEPFNGCDVVLCHAQVNPDQTFSIPTDRNSQDGHTVQLA